MQLAERVILVTGGARRLGRAIAVRLASDGARIAVHARASLADAQETARLCRAAGGDGDVFQADLADMAQTRALVPAVLQRFGRLDGLINNAAEFPAQSIEQFDLTVWEHTLRVNLTAPMVLVHAAHGALRQAGGRVVNLCDAAVAHPWPGHLAYMVSKGALDTLTRALARALAPEVNVVGIAPGIAAWPEHYDEATRARLTARVPLQRAGTPEDIAAAVHFVLTGGDYLTGVVLPVDGGRHVSG